MNRNSSFSAIGTSMVAHVVLLAGLTLIHFELNDKLPDIVLETVFDDEREQ